MRLLRLDLLAFGPFTDAAFDFSTPDGRPGLHLLYGPNEAGKTTARRAVRMALYGFGHRVEYDFRHAAKDQKIGMTLDGHDGSLAFVRRRGRKNTLLAADGVSALPDDTLAPLLAGFASAEEFERTFAIGEADLKAGGEAILQGKGDLSETLFMTAAGLPRLRKVEQEFNDKAKSLFLPTGEKPAINVALARWKEARAAAESKSLPAADYIRHSDALRTAKQDRANVESELSELRSRHAKLARLQQALPTAARYRQRETDLQAVADAPRLPEDFPERRRRLETDREIVAARLAQLDDEREQIDTELAGLTVPDELLSAAGEIDRLHKRLGSYEQAVADTSKRLEEIARFETEAADLLRDVRPDLDVADAESLRLTQPQRDTIGELADRRLEIATRQKTVDARLGQLRAEAAAAKKELATLGPDAPADRLRETLDRAVREGKVDAAVSTTRQEADKLRRQLDAALAGLSLWSGDADALARLPVPPAATLDRFAAEFDTLDRDDERLAGRRSEAEAQLRATEAELARLGRDGDVPTEDALRSARLRRDLLWAEVRRELAGQPPGSERASLLAAGPLPESFEAASRTADETADRLRREAKRAERFVTLSDDRERLVGELDRLKAAEAESRLRREALRTEWAAGWPFLDEVRTPREMQEWSARRDASLRLAESLHDAAARLSDALARRDAHRAALRAVLDGLDEPSADDDSLAAAVRLSERTLKRLDELAERRRTLSATLERVASEQRNAEEASKDDRAELAELRERWAEWMSRLGLTADAGPKSVTAFLSTAATVLDKLDKAVALGERVEQMRTHREEFDKDVRAAARRLAADLAERPPEEAAAALHDRLGEAKESHKRRRQLTDLSAAKTTSIGEAEQRAVELAAELGSLCRQACCDDPADLPAVEERSARRRSLEREVAEADAELAGRSGGRPVPEFLAELAGVDVDAITPDIDRLGAQIEELDRRSKALNLAIGSAEAEVKAMKGGTDAADEAEKAEAALADLARDVERYVRFRLAARLLRDGRERYRKQAGNAVFDHASRLFADLTCGRYSGLKVDFGENDEPTLLGVNADDGRTVRPDAMSDGTADQLYLALRLAGLHDRLARQEPLPFVVDDLLIHFDDDRAAAALRALADLSQRTQVLFFTHHRHLVDLAAACLPAGSYRLHDLRTRRDEDAEPIETNGRPGRSLF